MYFGQWSRFKDRDMHFLLLVEAFPCIFVLFLTSFQFNFDIVWPFCGPHICGVWYTTLVVCHCGYRSQSKLYNNNIQLSRFLKFVYCVTTVCCFVGVPYTGRMHQIRVHLQWLGYPIINDPIYNHTAWGPHRGRGGVSVELVKKVISFLM